MTTEEETPSPEDEELVVETETSSPESGVSEVVTGTTATSNIVEVAADAGQFTTLLTLLETTGLSETLATGGPYTVFAPTDEAFSTMQVETLQSLTADPDTLEQVLLYHAVDGRLERRELEGAGSIETLQGGTIDVALDNQSLLLNGNTDADVPGIEASNGVIYAIDRVLIPDNVDLPAVTPGVIATPAP